MVSLSHHVLAIALLVSFVINLFVVAVFAEVRFWQIQKLFFINFKSIGYIFRGYAVLVRYSNKCHVRMLPTDFRNYPCSLMQRLCYWICLCLNFCSAFLIYVFCVITLHLLGIKFLLK